MQSLSPSPEKTTRTPLGGLLKMIRSEGLLRPFRGVSSVAMGAIPAHALYFTIYDRVKLYLTGGKAAHSKTWAYGLAGVAATLAHDAVMNPAEGWCMIKTLA